MTTQKSKDAWNKYGRGRGSVEHHICIGVWEFPIPKFHAGYDSHVCACEWGNFFPSVIIFQYIVRGCKAVCLVFSKTRPGNQLDKRRTWRRYWHTRWPLLLFDVNRFTRDIAACASFIRHIVHVCCATRRTIPCSAAALWIMNRDSFVIVRLEKTRAHRNHYEMCCSPILRLCQRITEVLRFDFGMVRILGVIFAWAERDCGFWYV